MQQKITHNVTKAKVAMQMTTNTGGGNSDEHGKMIGLKHDLWVNEEGTANTASSGDLSDQCHVCFNDAEEVAFTI